jgi:hypothetical protein
MAFHIFTVPIQDDGRALEQLNAFLRSHKILSVDRRWVEQGAASFWSFASIIWKGLRPTGVVTVGAAAQAAGPGSTTGKR